MTRGPCERFDLVASDGAVITACAHGGQVLGWTPAGGESRLWISDQARCGSGHAIRGGVPVIWPQFSDRGNGPRHGVARDRAWSVVQAGSTHGDAELVMMLASNDETRPILQGEFLLTLTARAAGSQLDLTLTVDNHGAETLPFTGALHTYLRVSDARAATVHGLAGHDAEDNAQGRNTFVVPAEPLDAASPRDWAVRAVTGDVRLVDPTLPALTLSAEGFEDRVLWNPGPKAVPGDVHPGGENQFVCVEAAVLTEVLLAPGGRWVGKQVLRQG